MSVLFGDVSGLGSLDTDAGGGKVFDRRGGCDMTSNTGTPDGSSK